MNALKVELVQVECVHCDSYLVTEKAAYQIVVDRRKRAEAPGQVRCKFCEKMNVLELYEGRVVADAPRRGQP